MPPKRPFEIHELPEEAQGGDRRRLWPVTTRLFNSQPIVVPNPFLSLSSGAVMVQVIPEWQTVFGFIRDYPDEKIPYQAEIWTQWDPEEVEAFPDEGLFLVFHWQISAASGFFAYYTGFQFPTLQIGEIITLNAALNDGRKVWGSDVSWSLKVALHDAPLDLNAVTWANKPTPSGPDFILTSRTWPADLCYGGLGLGTSAANVAPTSVTSSNPIALFLPQGRFYGARWYVEYPNPPPAESTGAIVAAFPALPHIRSTLRPGATVPLQGS